MNGFRVEKIEGLFASVLSHACELIRTSETSLLEIAVAEMYVSKALMKIVAMTSTDMAKAAGTIEATLEAGLDSAALQEIVGFIREKIRQKEEGNEQSEDK